MEILIGIECSGEKNPSHLYHYWYIVITNNTEQNLLPEIFCIAKYVVCTFYDWTFLAMSLP